MNLSCYSCFDCVEERTMCNDIWRCSRDRSSHTWTATKCVHKSIAIIVYWRTKLRFISKMQNFTICCLIPHWLCDLQITHAILVFFEPILETFSTATLTWDILKELWLLVKWENCHDVGRCSLTVRNSQDFTFSNVLLISYHVSKRF